MTGELKDKIEAHLEVDAATLHTFSNASKMINGDNEYNRIRIEDLMELVLADQTVESVMDKYMALSQLVQKPVIYSSIQTIATITSCIVYLSKSTLMLIPPSLRIWASCLLTHKRTISPSGKPVCLATFSNSSFWRSSKRIVMPRLFLGVCTALIKTHFPQSIKKRLVTVSVTM